jgi:hypothetical protein
MSRITISDLAIDSNSFIDEVAETEAAFINGGGSFANFNAGFGQFAAFAINALLTAYVKGAAFATILDILKFN